MRHWIFSPRGAALYFAVAWSVGVSVGLWFRQSPRPLFDHYRDYCAAHRVSPAKCEALYYARHDTVWLADRPY